MLCDANGTPLRFLLSGGQASDISYAQPLLDEVSIPSRQRGRPRKRCKWLLADKGYDAEALRRYCDQYRMQPVIPLRSMKRKPKPGLPRLFDRPKYRQRNIIERMFGWLKENRRIVTRFDKLAKSYAAMVSLACSMRCLRQLFSYRAYTQGAPSGGRILYLHPDHLNAPRIATSQQAIVWSWNSDAFGATPPNEDVDGDGVATHIPLRFPGQYYDAQTQLSYNYFRDYDANLGRYVESDPSGLNKSLNSYNYVDGNPTIFIDSDGRAKDKVIGSKFDRPGPVDQSGRTAPTGAPISEPVQAPRSAGEQMANRIIGQILSTATKGAFKVKPGTGDIFPVTRSIFGTIGFGVSLWAGGEGLSCDEYDCTHDSSNLPYTDRENSCGAK